MCEECERKAELFNNMVKTGGGEAAQYYLRGLSEEDVEILHEAIHDQMVQVTTGEFEHEDEDERASHAGMLVSIHNLVCVHTQQEKQGYPLTEDQEKLVAHLARRALSIMLHIPVSHIKTFIIDEGQDAPGFGPTESVKSFHRIKDKAAYDAVMDGLRKHATPLDDATPSDDLTPEQINETIEAIIRDTRKRPKPPVT